MSCQFCGKQLNRGSNLRRHEKDSKRDLEHDALTRRSESWMRTGTMSANGSFVPLIKEASQRSKEEENLRFPYEQSAGD